MKAHSWFLKQSSFLMKRHLDNQNNSFQKQKVKHKKMF